MLNLIDLFWMVPVLIFAVVYVYGKRSKKMCRCKTDMTGKTVIVTGGNSGIGLETARELARRGAKVILACRNEKRVMSAIEDIVRTTGNEEIVFKQLDLCSFASVRRFANDVLNTEERLDVLINNAGINGASERELTEDGCEKVMQSNHFGHFLLTILLLDLLKKTAPSRIVVVASLIYLFSVLKLDNLDSSRMYINLLSYANSKTCNILFTRELARKLEGTGVTVNCVHPGIVRSGLFRDETSIISRLSHIMTNVLGKTCLEGAQTTLHVALSPDLEDVSGKYFEDCQKARIYRRMDKDSARRLWQMSEEIVGLAPSRTLK